MLQVTPAEWAAIEAAGSGVLLREGSGFYSDNPEPFGKVWEDDPPAEFVEAAQPCEHPADHGDVPDRRRCLTPGCDGKRRVAVVVPCRVCQDLMATVPHVVAKGEHPDGLVTVGHVVVTSGPDLQDDGQYAIGVEVAA